MSKKRQFIMIFKNENSHASDNFSDLLNDNRVIVLNGWSHEPNNCILKFLKRIHFSMKLNKIIKLPLKHLWKYTLEDIKWNHGTEYYIISTGFYPIDIKYLKKKRNEYDVKYILFSQDAWDDARFSRVNQYYDEKLHFDLIITINNSDVEKYNFIFSDHFYSMLLDNVNSTTKYDLYFIGVNKGRVRKLLDIFDEIKSNNISAYYMISDVPQEERKYQDEIIYPSYRDRVPYKDVVREIKCANCILEVLTDIQTGASLRYYEAVCYNKKLLTNNKNVVNLPFYNPDYIHVFEKPEDIDCEWVKERIPVDYHYDGRFSPRHLIDQIIQIEKEE